MGEVYRARDTNLARDVAIKVLPEEVASDGERLARFKREAQLLAALNHPGIAAIHGLESANGKPFLVLELVEGEDLADRLKRGAIPVEEALSIARQIAEALEEAHERGIVHRDLKPANVKLTPEGKVKVLDFGLARAYSDDVEGRGQSDVEHSPTLTRGTQVGVILGTAAYMSPEQARGKPVDRRADIWAFGVVLYEMLAGKKVFEGETASDTLAHVLTREPDLAALPGHVPGALRALLADCLVREPKQRLRDIGDARRQIERAALESEAPGSARARSSRGRGWPWLLIPVALAVGAFANRATAPRPAPAPPRRLSIELGVDASLAPSEAGPAAILSPDGTLLAFVARKHEGDRAQLFVRRLDQLEAAPLPGTEGAHSPFFSPDGHSIGFFADGLLKRIAVAGGSAFAVADAPSDRGGSWSDDGTIVYAPNYVAGVGLRRVMSSGGPIQVLTRPDPTAQELTHRWPQVLPGSRAVLYTVHETLGNYDNARVVVQAFPNGPRKTVVSGGYHGRYVPSGHLLYMHGGVLFAIPFDLAKLETTGVGVPFVEGVIGASITAGAQFAFSNTGTLVYLPGGSGNTMLSMQWLDHTGKLSNLRAAPGVYRNARISPDGTKIAFQVFDGKSSDVWIYEWARDTVSRLTFDVTGSSVPVWSPDGRGIVFSSAQGGKNGRLYWRRADGTGGATPLTESQNFQAATSWHPSGKFIAFQELRADSGYDVMLLPIEGDAVSGYKAGEPRPFLDSPFNEWQAMFSPNGRWLAYASNETGRSEVYVRQFPGPGGKWQVSPDGGSHPTWSQNGRELFYQASDDRLMLASYVEQGASFQATKPRLWCDVRLPELYGQPTFDLHPDGQRFAVVVAEVGDARRSKVILFQNFLDELRRLAPGR